MKKYLPQIDLLTLMAGAVGILLRFWLLSLGEDDKGLYPAHHISWILLLVLSAAVAVCLFLIARFAGKERSYRANFPASALGAMGYAAAALGLALAGRNHFDQENLFLYPVAGFTALFAAVALLWGCVCRMKGTRPHYLVFALPCLYFGLRLFCMGHMWGDEPEMSRFLFSFLATAALIPACYQLWAFAVGLGNRSACLLGSLLAVYLCLVAVPGDTDALLYLTAGCWLLLNLCPPKPPVRRSAPVEQPEEEPPAPQPEELLPEQRDAEIDAIIAELMLQTDDLKE